MSGLAYRFFCVFGALLLAVAGSAPAVAGRVALVIGNSDYAHVPHLPNAVQDARDVAAALRALGFEVHDGYDLTRVKMLRLTSAVSSQLGADDVALFYFSGHGIQIGAENYIIPVDAAGDDGETLRNASVKLQSVLRELELRAQRNIIILDACRNNPFQSQLAGRAVGEASRGLARVDAGVGTYIAFSTQPGNVALDGSGQNSPFTAALLQHLRGGDDDLHELMRKVRADVVAETNGTQVPWENSSMIEQVFLGKPDGRPVAGAPGGAGSAIVAAPPVAQPGVQQPVLQQPVLQQPIVQPPAQNPATLPSQPQLQFTHMVSGLDPNGDGFLALREGTTANSRRIARMTEGTRLAVIEQDGVWFHVVTETGLNGWAHSNWVRFVGAAPAPQPVLAPRQAAPAATPANQCDALWLQRNAYFARYGYCFKSARGKAAFPNPNCNPAINSANAPLTPAERADVARIEAEEARFGCR